MGAHVLKCFIFFKLLLLVVSSSLDFGFGLGLTLGLELGLRFGFSFKVGVRACIEFYCLHPGVQKSFVFYKLWEFFVHWLEIKLGLKFYHYPSLELDRHIYWSADIFWPISERSRYIVSAIYCR